MKIINKLFSAAIVFSALFTYSQSVEIGEGAEIIISSGSDICASSWGNITGNITGSGTQCDGVLPVTLISFSAAVENERNVKLTWTTAIEINNSGFDIERLSYESIWTKIAWVSGSGNSNSPKEYSYNDKALNRGIYNYRLRQIDYNGFAEFYNLNSQVEINSPGTLSLSQNYPNPSNPFTTIQYQVPYTTKVVIKIYDVSGSEVTELVSKIQEAGYYEVKFDGSNLASGVYFYKLLADRSVIIKKMVLVK